MYKQKLRLLNNVTQLLDCNSHWIIPYTGPIPYENLLPLIKYVMSNISIYNNKWVYFVINKLFGDFIYFFGTYHHDYQFQNPIALEIESKLYSICIILIEKFKF